MTIYDISDQPRLNNGTFTEKTQNHPEIDLTYPALPSYDPTFFYDRTVQGNQLNRVEVAALTAQEQALVRNCTQAVNDTWALEHGSYETGQVGSFVETTVWRDGDFLVADVQHKDQEQAPYGSLVVFDASGTVTGRFDNVSDEFGERWIPMGGLRSQLVDDLNEITRDNGAV